MKGEDVLRALVEICDEKPELDQALEAAARAARIATRIGAEPDGRTDGRLVAAKLIRLEREKLVSSGFAKRRLKSGRIKTYSHRVYSPTSRGRELIRLLNGFHGSGFPTSGLLSVGFTSEECSALSA